MHPSENSDTNNNDRDTKWNNLWNNPSFVGCLGFMASQPLYVI